MLRIAKANCVLAFFLAALCPAQEGGYGGPSILTRGGAPSPGQGGAPISIRGFASVSSVLQSGLTPNRTDSNGEIRDDSAYGVMGVLGAYGVKTGRRYAISLDYQGNYRHFQDQRYYNGSDQNLRLAYRQLLRRNLSFFISNQAGVRTNSFGGFGQFGLPVSIDLTLVDSEPTEEVFDNRTIYAGSIAGFSYQKTRRLSFTWSGGGFLVRRHARGLVGVNAVRANGTVNYLLSRRTTVGASYRFDHFYFPGSFGDTYSHSTMGVLNHMLSRRWTARLSAGFFRPEMKRLTLLAVDPIVAAITGQSRAVEVFYGTFGGAAVQAGIAAAWARSRLSVDYQRGLNPGNGILLTSQRETVGASYSFTGTRRWNTVFSGNWYRMKPLSGTFGTYEGYIANAGSTYRLTSHLHLTARYSYMRTEFATQSAFRRNRYRAMLGISFTTGEYPLTLW